MSLPTTNGSLSVLQPGVQGRPADLCQRGYVGLRQPGGDTLAGELPEFDGRFLDLFGVLSPVGGVLSDPLTEFCGVHAESVKHLTRQGKGRKVLYMESREYNMGRVETPGLMAVKVVYEVERTVYVYAFSASEARSNARDYGQWVDAENDQHERMETVRVPRDQS